ncbi:2-C-methyl-D-erythritol 4-phosphate cytidylyltransferase [Clostridium sp. FAM 1755]|jgi:2-C-methyl-D-erythritol 4-phosphate cytidylyltransferase|uniref:2-C-methyl-D-erythritol 4-phosphate cytidylyltransferase n=1 Tax=Clostridium TaxID=1485 RepID=UPI0006AB8F8E|nr:MULTISPECIES: 2-C-methyl-D-erythritol 4-phosphate cytidylyltransferase [Clostridium]KOR26359.1 2-C-methyl-D-erythritol 4-phosphate cytidylyltransferase [Clostridium sp. L74]NFN88421.1 2-C-methyl-D-erythritol 4-phosphate cytidylyltransferase [Clostridium sporogenes]NFS24399.1 2-C-methyl-D-erythritol 4-phosphate cytidylyltransferase [Clostridium sporogenes]NFV13330.1 2-C-methyl-D-erythritol 4-phosphate cytidylyltransferase [Clostridium sporogenes]
MSKNSVIIVAAGKGKRMNSNISKQFLKIKNKPILYYTLNKFSNHKDIDEIVLVTLEDKIEACKNIIKKYNIDKISKIVSGGRERQDSVYNGLKAVSKDCDVVLIHDAARPFVTSNIIDDGIKYAKQYEAAACGVTPKDTIKIKDKKGFSIDTPNREDLFIVQTPQCFSYNVILDCHENLKRHNRKVTDDTMVLETYGKSVYLYEGSYSNIKITTPEDLILGEQILEKLT